MAHRQLPQGVEEGDGDWAVLGMKSSMTGRWRGGGATAMKVFCDSVFGVRRSSTGGKNEVSDVGRCLWCLFKGRGSGGSWLTRGGPTAGEWIFKCFHCFGFKEGGDRAGVVCGRGVGLAQVVCALMLRKAAK
jgi:hypothetical protein